MNIADIATAILRVREAHQYCTSNPLHINAHDFEHCPMYLYIKQLVQTEQYLASRDK